MGISVTVAGTAPTAGMVVATYTGWTTGTSVYICYSTGTATGVASPACGAAGTATTLTAGGSGTTVQCTAAATTGAAVSLTWTEAAQDFIRARACLSNGDSAQTDNAEVGLSVAAISLTIPTAAPNGGSVTATYTGWTTGTSVYICYSTGTATGVASPACGAAGTASTLTAAGSGTTVQCTAAATTGAAVSLTWTEIAQDFIRARACLSNGDSAQTDNAEVGLTVTAITVALTPLHAYSGDTLTATYTGWTTGTSVYICYKSGTATGVAAITCGAANSATTITASGSGTAVVCTEAATTGTAVSLTWTEPAQDFVRVRACLASADSAQTSNAETSLIMTTSSSSSSSAFSSSSSSTTTTNANSTTTPTSTTTGTPTTLSVASTRIVQGITFSTLNVTDYIGTTKLSYECAFLDMLDSTWCVAGTGSISWLSGVSMTSTGVDTRRSGKVTFTAKVATTLATAAQVNSKVTTAGTAWATNFITQLNAVNTATGYAIAVPTAASITADTAATTSLSAAGVVTSSASAVVPSLLAGTAALLVALTL